METNADRSTFRSLRRFNVAMGILHLLQGVLMLALSNDFTVPISTYFLKFQEGDGLVTDPKVLFDLPLGPFIASFLFMSALAHFAVSTPGIYDWYVHNLKQGINKARWIEYSFSASVMIVAIAALFGMYDIAALLLIFALNASMILFGWMMELHNQTTDKVNWTAFIFGCIVGIVPWIAVGIYFVGSVTSGEQVPSFVYAIYVSLFLFFNVFAVNQVLQYAKVGRWRDYVYGERAYIVLSLVAKSLLAWQVFFGTLQPS
ncbi:MAG TPA: heliorhodopsin HeR [Aggregatilinea sp.]|uniref:heliorhodopsin HeR n=1 Tax=Aggregatilinea sp. TaxID=2806333 RepID=UPI002C8B8C24|nr:heliorhodopsin HeR [Aggregatilinea sp.]HML24802.1 heliorhodopsin HeR [Aggregatilinea sp.]